MSISALTIVKNRSGHLAQLIEGLRRSAFRPCELIVVDMGSDRPVIAAEAPFDIRIVRCETDGLPLASARNAAARAASGEHFLFLDVDCIPMRDLVGEVDRWLTRQDALICAEIFYLGPSDARGAWTEDMLISAGTRHPVRTFPVEGICEETDAGLFWSLAFGVRRNSFFKLGCFDETFAGYGAEDTDFGFRARAEGLPMMFMGGPGAFHQHHDVFDPPLQHFEDIIRNARIFHDRWSIWPMEGWLDAFAHMGLIDRSLNAISILRAPSPFELTQARLSSAF